MKTIYLTLFIFLLAFFTNVSAQDESYLEDYGGTLNLGLGIGYYGYVGHSMPVLHADYEFSIVKNFTIAPFVSFYTYRSKYFYSNHNNYYYYHETVIPVGVKASYYFDDLLQAGQKWDFYAAGSLGFAISTNSWDDGYDGDINVYHSANPLFLNAHIGAEYHFTNRIGAFLDLSTGVSTIGISIH